MSALWNPQQREWLQALGHAPLRLAGEPRSRADLATDPGATPAAAVSADGAMDPLYRALLRATGHRPMDAEPLLRELQVDPAALRGSPAAKRALWPRLRRLRGARSR